MELEKLQKAIVTMNGVIEAILDDEKGCPWDKEQTPTSLSEYTIEEMFEFVDAIRKDNSREACEEMGDLIFGVLLIAKKYAPQIRGAFLLLIRKVRIKQAVELIGIFGLFESCNIIFVGKNSHELL